MAQEFTSDSIGSACRDLESGKPKREAVRMLLLGTPEGVREEINNLQQRGFAEAGAWSRLLPGLYPGEVMSIFIRYRRPKSTDISMRKSGR
jgi:hypothetical protein